MYVTCANPPKWGAKLPARKRLNCCGKPAELFCVSGWVAWNDVLESSTITDNAFTRPWTVERQYRREHEPIWEEYNCMEDNRWVVLGGWVYLLDDDGYLMPTRKDQPAPDLRYFDRPRN